MLKIILRTTHTIFDELLNRSQNKKLLATTTYNKNWKTKWKNLMSALKKKQRKELPRRNFDSCQKSLQLEYLFIISEIFLEFIYKLHALKMSMKPNHPWNPNCLSTENESKKNSIKTSNLRFGFEKLKKIPGKKTQTNYVWLSYWEKRKLLIFFRFGSQWPKKLFHFSNKIKKNKRTLPTIY